MNRPERPRERREAYRRSRALGQWLTLFLLVAGLVGIVVAARWLGAFA